MGSVWSYSLNNAPSRVSGIARSLWLHEADYRSLCGLQIVRSRTAHIKHLWVIDDRGINDAWVSRLEEVRCRIRKASSGSGPERVMLTRGKLGATRNLVNSEEVTGALQRLGFEIVSPEMETSANLVRKLADAKLVIAVEGSGANHCWLSMPPKSSFIAIQPPTRFNAHGKMRADAAGIRWAFVVADPHAEGFALPVDRLLRTIDEVNRVV